MIAAFALLACLTIPMRGWADEWSYTFNASSGITKGDNTLNNVSWNVAHDSDYENNEATGYHVGSSSKSVSYLQFSTSGISGTISQIVVNAKGNGSNGTISASVNNVAYTSTNSSITNSFQDFTFTGSSEGDIVIRLAYNSAQKKNFYVASITVTFSTGSAITHAYTLNVTGDDANADVALYVDGNELAANDEIAEGKTVTVSVIPSDGYTYSVAVVDANNASVEYDEEMDSFTMPTSDVTITVTTSLIPTYTVTFNTNGGTFVGNEDFPQVSNTKEAGNYTLPSATKSGSVFVGWLAAGSANAVSGNYEVSGNVEFTAQWAQGITDVLNRAFTGVTSGSTNYSNWSNKKSNSDARYTGNSAGGNNSIQLRSSQTSGIITTTSGGKVTKVVVTWNSNTLDGRTLDIYGKNTAYSSVANLFSNDANTQGTLLGSLTCPGQTELIITGDYTFIGLRSHQDAMYLEEIQITWGSTASLAAPTINPETLMFENSQEITITAEEGANIRYTIDGTEPTTTTGTVYSGPFTISNNTTVKAIAYKVVDGETITSNVAEATYTRLYNITVNQANGGTISANKSQAAVDETITLTATANIGYAFGSWSVTPSSVTVASNQFTMPASDVTVTATFTTATAYTVSFSVNNKIEMTATVNSGNSIDLTKFVAEGDGYTFEGWSTTAGEEIITPQNAYTPTGNITLYPGVAPAPTGDEYTLVTDVSDLHAGDLVVIAANGSDNIAMSKTQNNNNRARSTGVEKSAQPYTNLTITGDDVCELTLGTATIEGNTYWTFFDAGYANGTGGYLYAAGSGSGNNYLKTKTSNDDNGKWSISVASGGAATVTAQGSNTNKILRYNSGSKLFSCYSSGQQEVWLYTKPASNSVKGNRDGVPTTSKVTGIAANVLVTVKSNGVVYLTGSNAGNAANLVVEDGGQLVTSADVQGIMQKTILGYDPSANPSNGWYFISSSLKSSVNVSDVQNLINASGTDYDLYYFKQNPDDGLEWINQKNNNGFTELYEKTGYLYANAAQTTTLGFAGMLRKNDNSEQVSKNLAYYDSNVDENMHGWNLVGNPFPSYAKVDRAFFRMKNTNDGINTEAVPANSVINTTEGVFVHASQTGENVTFTATTSTGSKSRLINIDVARQGEMLDNAIVSLNAEGSLCKLVLNENTTRVYFHQDEKDYAILTSSSENEVPVSFKASRNGSYTITVNPEDVEMNYLHLIDNMTGADVDLLANPSYTFEAKKTDYKSRFRLVFSANSIDEASTSSSFAHYNGTGWTVTNEGEATLQVVDVTGRIVSSEAINGCANININAANGVYMLRLVNGNNVKTQKIVVK